MPWLQVGPTVISVAPGSGQWDWNDAVDRRRAFDNTYRASATGGAARDFHFTTPPVTLALAATYRAALQNVAAQLCSGDVMEVPTMCCAEVVNESPVRLSVGHRIVMEIALHEVQPKKLLLKYTPGDTIAGEAFTRSTTGYQIGFGGSPNSVAINTKRDAHWLGGVRSLLLEDTRQNNLLQANDFSNAAWAKLTCTITTGIADPTGGTTACTLTATGANATVSQLLSNGASLARTFSVWLRRRTGVGTIQVLDGNGGAYTTVALSASWTRFSKTGAASVFRQGGIKIVTSGDAIDAWCGDDEDGAFPSSEIVTTTVALARGADTYSLPSATPPVEMTGYVKFVEKGTAQVTGGVVVLFANAAGGNPQFACYATGGVYHVFHHNGTSSVDVALAVTPAIGDTVELVFRLYGDGSVDITQSINGAAPTSSAQSAANALASAWAGQLCYLNSIGTTGTGVGFIALQALRLIAGARSLTDMRAA